MPVSRAPLVVYALSLALGAATSSTLAAETGAVPPHATANAFATSLRGPSGWPCDRGSRPAGATYVRIAVPAHGHLSDAGDGLECERGYAIDHGRCMTR
jgi:hypothetical protein